ncbi:peptidoglycan DD-metalloendopeptidase family protein, partial [Patescibacteria group bacterium]|nr:peptidoglycan DD-metalloendopeptidase family protein [Patescibacteria group bacterium]
KTKLDWKVSYETIEDVLYSLKKLDEGEEIEAEQRAEFEKACRNLLAKWGYSGEINLEDEGSRREIMAFLSGLTEGETEEESGEKEMGSKSLNAVELEKLVADYEKALAEGKDREKAAAEFEKKSGKNVRNFVTRQQEIYLESLKRSTAVEKAARVETEMIAHRLAQKIGGEREVTKAEELVVAVLRGQKEEIKEGEVEGVSGVELKEANQAIAKTKETKGEILEIEEKRVLREAIVIEVAKAPGNEEVAREKIEKYAGMVANLSVSGAIEAYREEAREETEKTGVSPGQFEEGFVRTKVVYRMLVTGNFRRDMATEEEARREIPNLAVADNFRQVRAVGGVMREMRAPDVVNSFIRARRRIAGVRGWIGAFKSGGMDGVVLNLKNKIGAQPLVAFAKETSLLMSQGKNLGQALGMAFKGLATSGKVAAGAGVKAGAGVAAKGVAGALGGPIGWVIALAPLVKKVFGKIGKVMENLGLSLGIKKWMRENIGNIPGGLMGAGVALGGVALALGGAVGAAFTAAIAIIPIVIIGLFAFLVGYPLLLQSGQISSLVAPVGTGGGEELFESTGVGVSDIPLPEWSTNLELPESCPEGFPVTGGVITQGPLASNCSHQNMTNAVDIALGTKSKVRTTHEGVIRAGTDRIYGNFVEVKAKCNGDVFVTRYAHLIEAMNYGGDQMIKKGAVVGEVDNTGSSSGPHIHYDIRGSLKKGIEEYLGMPKNSLRGCCINNGHPCLPRLLGI